MPRARAVFVVLCLLNNRAFWSYAFFERGVLTAKTLPFFLRHALSPLALAAAVLAAAAGLGAWLLDRALPLRPREPLDHVLALALGLGVWASAVFLLGLAGGLKGPGLAGLAGACGIVGAAGLQRSGFRWSAGALEAPWLGLVRGALLYAGWHTAVLALAPPTEWDILAYHLPIPKLYLAWGAVREIPWMLHSHWPHLMEAFYAFPLWLGEDAVAALVHAACCWALVAGTYWAARQELDETTAWIAAAVVAAQPTFLRIAGTAHSDGALALLQFSACWALWRHDARGERRWLLVAAAFSGLAASCKLFGAAPIAAWSVWLWLRRGRRDAGTYLAVSFAVVAPWYLKTWAGAGNPIWPFFSRWLGGAWGASVIEGPYLASTRWPSPPEWDLFVRYGPQYLIVPLAGLGLAAWRARLKTPRFIRFCFIPALAYVPVVLRQQEAWRFLLPLFPAMGLLLGWWAARLAEKSRGLRWAASAAVAVALAPAAMANQSNELFSISGVRSKLLPMSDPRELYLERSLDHYLPFALIRRDVPKDARVLLYREVRSYHLGLDYQWGDPLNQAVIPYALLKTPEELRARLAGEGITHVLVNDELAMYAPSQKYYDRRTLELMDETLKRFADPPRRYGPISLYRLRASR